MDIDRFMAKPVEVEVGGEKVMMQPLTTEFYPLIAKLSFYSQKILTARSKLQKDEVLDVSKIFTPTELEDRAEIESEIAFLTMEKTFGITKEQFKGVRNDVIEEVMKGAMKANGLTDEKLKEIEKALMKNDK